MKHMKRMSAVLAALVVICGCTATPEPPPKYEVAEVDKFAPINFDVYAGEYVTAQTSEVANFIARTVADSGRFIHVQSGMNRWPFSVQLKYGFTQKIGAMEFIGTMISAASLLIIPGSLPEEHTYSFHVLYGPNLIAKYNYSEQVKNKLWLFNMSHDVRKDAAARTVKKFISDLERDKVIPTARDFEEAEKNQERGT